MDFLYCGTDAQVDAKNTQALLLNEKAGAIWCPPPSLPRFSWPAYPNDGDRLWLIWRKKQGTTIYLLGGGRIRIGLHGCCGEGTLWTDQILRAAARRLGYTVKDEPGKETCFLRLQDPKFLPENEILPITGLGNIRSGLKPATDSQVVVMESALPL
jgi:hypothetical protein